MRKIKRDLIKEILSKAKAGTEVRIYPEGFNELHSYHKGVIINHRDTPTIARAVDGNVVFSYECIRNIYKGGNASKDIIRRVNGRLEINGKMFDRTAHHRGDPIYEETLRYN